VTVGIGAIAHGTDIAGSIRYPAYACGVHGLRPTVGRVPAFNAALPERTIGGQICAVSGPLARSIADLRLALTAMAARDVHDPWWVPAPLVGSPAQKRAAICVAPDGLDTHPQVAQAVRDAGARLEAAGWRVDELATPPLAEAAEAQTKLVFADGYADLLARAEREGDAGALNVLARLRSSAPALDQPSFSRVLIRRATLLREWLMFFETYAVLVIPVSAELPFENHLDMQGDDAFARVWRAQMLQLGLPYLGLPVLTVSTGLLGRTPVGVQVVSGRYREDLCLAAGEAIEAGGTPPAPVDPSDD
jgi:amidase